MVLQQLLASSDRQDTGFWHTNYVVQCLEHFELLLFVKVAVYASCCGTRCVQHRLLSHAAEPSCCHLLHCCDNCAGAKDPTALETLVKSMNVKTESVNRDLTAYKGILSKLNAAKELMAELLAREKKKAQERLV